MGRKSAAFLRVVNYGYEIAFQDLRSQPKVFLEFSRTRSLSTISIRKPGSLCSASGAAVQTFQRHPYSSFRIAPEVTESLEKNAPVVALESAILTHGMPYPHNIDTALKVQEIIREEGAIPATVGIVKGQLTVGLTDKEIGILGGAEERDLKDLTATACVKVSRRDIPFALSQKLHGGTTVSGTIVAAALAKIPIFVTGGLGGVHRGAELTFDVSPDLRELGRNPIAVISAGVKSILDIGKTLEYLETEGVCVCVLKRDDTNKASHTSAKFPSFFTAESAHFAPYRVNDESQAAQLIHSALEFGLGSGVLIAVPIPKNDESGGEDIEKAIMLALENAIKTGIMGRDMTPYLLGQVNEITGGASLEANKALIYNNAKVGARIAVDLAKLKRGEKLSNENSNYRPNIPGGNARMSEFKFKDGSRPVVIGGSSLDIIFAVKESEIVNDGRTLRTEVRSVPGGVGRNMAEALGLLGHDPLLISAIGDDLYGKELLRNFENSKLDCNGINITEHSTAIYSAVLNKSGECMFGMGQMQVHDNISPEQLEKYEHEIKSASLVVLDANIPVKSMEYAMRLCTENKIPVWFEPTELRKAKKLLEVNHSYWPCVTYFSPNLNELLMMQNLTENENLDKPLILLTKGKVGFSAICRSSRRSNSGPINNCGYNWIDFPAPELHKPNENIVSVSGAGDCLNAGFISGLIMRQELQFCANKGTECAKKSLLSSSNVPRNL